QLWLSSDTNSSNKTRIAYTDSATGFREWGKYATQKSASITLEAGKYYYIEALHKEGIGGDNLSVSWSGPGFDQVILGAPHVTQQFYNHGAPVLASQTVTVSDRDSQIATQEAKDWSDPGTRITYSITGGNADGAFTIDPATGTITASGSNPFLPLGSRVLTITASDNGLPTALSSTATVTVNVLKAGLKREIWRGLPGGQALTDLTNWLFYPQAPDETGYALNFKTPTNSADNYGQRVSGYVIPPDTGNYTFWIASDDGGELWLSSDTNPANKKRIGYVVNSVNEEEWTAQGNQQSAVIPLVAGQRYYIEALQKEGNGGDHLAVAWQGPAFARTVISANNLEYPDFLRPVLRREVWTATSPVAWTDSLTPGVMDWSTALLTEAFEGTGALSGNASETGGRTWAASTGWTRSNGVATKTGTGDALALLPFTPQAGKVYTLSLELDPTNSPGSQDWLSLGFLSQPASNTALYTQTSVFPTYGLPWVLLRANGNENGNTVRAFSSGAVNPVDASPAISAVGSYDRLAVVLDTRAANWVSRYYFNGALVGSHTHPGSLAIQSVGFSAFNTARGNVRNFRLASNDAPATGSGGPEGTLMSFKGATSAGDGFSERITGFVVPPVTGNYTFWLASDDDGELRLSSDDSPANLAKIASVTGFVDPDSWDVSPSQRSAALRLVAGQRYYVEVRHRDGSFGDHVSVAWEGPGITRQIVGNAYLEHPAAPADRTLLKREIWTGAGGNDVTSLTNLATYPAAPSTTGTLAPGIGFRTGTDVTDNFGDRVSGFLVAPDTGRYTFWIASDDSSELWLSTNDNPANRIRLASVGGSVAEQNWDAQAGQKSVPVALEAGKRYYVETLRKEGIGGDHLAVAWQGPSFARQLISNACLEHLLSAPGTPSIKREVWTSIPGSNVTDLTSAGAFITGSPAARGVLTALEAPSGYGDNYGQRLTARLVAPETGNFKFWIASGDASELWLSTDADPANRVRIAFTTAVTGPRNWSAFPTQQSTSLALVAGRKYHLEILHKESVGEDYVAVAWQGPSFDRKILDGRFLEYPGNTTPPVALKREVWTGIGGNNVTDLTSTARYPNAPNLVFTLNEFNAPVNWGDNYGQRISGYVIAPRAGDYQFWIASDDGSELWLSTNGVPANKARIAYATAETGEQNWTSNATQASAVITLAAGQRCYIEALHKDGIGGDYAAVAWQGPGFSRQIISAQFLEYPGLPAGETESGSLVSPGVQDPGYTFWLDSVGLQAGNRLTSADPDGDGLVNSLEFVLGGLPIGVGANSLAVVPQLTLDDDSVIFTYRRADVAFTAGSFVESSTDLVTWTPVIDGINGAGISVVDDGVATGIDQVTVKVPRTEGIPVFLRLNSNMP
ncbi:MAG: uncharacterized protein JWO82_2382, partial [Akkermansiaceae bacterium]|nr:uncharacterized protein [Akkermansiaceae bacterium]